MQKKTDEKLQDEGKLAYMISWRDRRIAALEELVHAQEIAGSIYAAYIAYLLEACAMTCESGKQLRIPKQEIRRVCGLYAVHAEDAGEDFMITLTERGEDNGAQSSEMADA